MNGFDYFERGLKKFAHFKGRASRKEFWYFMLFTFLAHASVSIFSAIMEEEAIFALGNTVLFIGFFIPSLALLVRRLHDSGKSGWFALLAMFPPAMIVLFIFSLLKSDAGENQYGYHPEDIEEDYWDDESEEEFLEDFGDQSIPTRGRDRRY